MMTGNDTSDELFHEHFEVTKNSLRLFLQEALTLKKVNTTELLYEILEEVFNTFTTSIDCAQGNFALTLTSDLVRTRLMLVRSNKNGWLLLDGEESLSKTADIVERLANFVYPVQ